MRIARVDETLEACQSHLDSTGPFNTEIDTLLAYSSLVIIYAEFERMVMHILNEKCSVIEDEAIRKFAESFGSIMARRIYSSDLSDVLNRFGSEYKNVFNSKIRESLEHQRAATSYNNIITNRNDTAHSAGSNATFLEVRNFYEEGHVVLDFFRETLMSIDPPQPTA